MSTSDPPSARPTLKSIAYLTGLGISTVSRALKDGPEISEDTRARVKLIARQIGYRPDRAGVRLRTGKTNVITVVLNPLEEGSGFFSNFVYGISDALAGTSYHLVITPYSLADPMEPVRYIAETRSADGVILSRTQPDDPRVRYLMAQDIPFATHGRTEMGLDHPFHDFDNEAYAFEALRVLAQKGRRRVALMGPPPGLTYHKHTHRGFERGLRAFGLAGMPIASADIDSHLREVRAAARALGESGEPPDGVVCSAVSAACAMSFGMRDAGLEPGVDFDIVTKHATDFLQMIAPEIISIPENFHEAGHSLARKLMARIGGTPAAELQHIVTPVTAPA